MEASKLCGSVLGLDMMALVCTYLPPTWLMTLAYWLSAPTATILPLAATALAPPERATARVPITAAATASTMTATGQRLAPRRAAPPPALPRIPVLLACLTQPGSFRPVTVLMVIVSIISKQPER